jgi:uncharacterized membrane protein
MYAAILALTWLYAGGSTALAISAVPFWPIQAIAAAGFLFSVYFTHAQAFVFKAFCTWCVLSAINFTVLFFAVWFGGILTI